MADRIDAAYGPAAERRALMNVAAGNGTLDEIVAFASSAVPQDA